MNKLTIPALLLGVVMIAGIFAFMPVQEASTVHTTLQETSTNIVSISATSTTDSDDFTVTCPATADACRILEIYIDDDSTGNVDPGAATIDIDGAGAEAAFQIAADTGAAVAEIEALTNVANLTIPPTGVLRIEVADSDATHGYTLTVIAETEANETITVARIAD